MCKKIAALFIDENGPYPQIPFMDCWGVSRDARNYTGDLPVIAHPPCNRWGKLAPVNFARWGTPIGEDGGCFASALESVRRCCGVLEHPASSLAYKHFDLPTPQSNGKWNWIGGNEYVCEMYQSDYGHPATKRTWLFYVGKSPLQFIYNKTRGRHQIGGGVRSGNNAKPRLKQGRNHISPPRFVEYLTDLALWAK